MKIREFITESTTVEYNGIRLDVFLDGANIGISAMRGGDQMGYVVFDRDGNDLTPADLAVEDEYKGRGVAKTMYDYVKSLGFKIRASSDQTRAGKAFWKKNRGEERIWEDSASVGQTISLNQLYDGNLPDRNERIWDVVGTHEMNNQLTISTVPAYKLRIILMSQYRVEHLDEIVDMMEDEQKETLEFYMNDPTLSDKIIVLSGSDIIDGNHRALAAAYNEVPINYVELSELDDDEE